MARRAQRAPVCTLRRARLHDPLCADRRLPRTRVPVDLRSARRVVDRRTRRSEGLARPEGHLGLRTGQFVAI